MAERLRGFQAGAAVLVLVAGGCSQTVEERDGAASDGGAHVTVVFGDAGHVVELTTLPTTDVAGTPAVGLQAVVEAALPEEDCARLVAGFVAADGFRPESSYLCTALVPVDWDTLGRGFIDPATRNLLWDAALGYPGCLSPRDVAELDVTRP